MHDANALPARLDLRPFLCGKDTQLPWKHETMAFDTPELVANISADLAFQKNTTGFRIKGRVTGQGKAPCQSCLATRWHALDETIDEIYVLKQYGKQKDKESQVELQEHDFYEVVDPMHPFDVVDVVRQTAILGLPLFTICPFALDDCPDAVFETPVISPDAKP
jgi:uncharacterized metal-binding protein YceD (DUF177 family)